MTKNNVVDLLCLCLTPWIDGSTSAAIYPPDQRKKFNVHCYCRCQNWFHTYCLKVLEINPPKRNSDFICPCCEIPETLPWDHQNYTSTCSVDNFDYCLSTLQGKCLFLEKCNWK